jgi:hypothetical protein
MMHNMATPPDFAALVPVAVITDPLEEGVPLALHLAGHAGPRTTRLYGLSTWRIHATD